MEYFLPVLVIEVVSVNTLSNLSCNMYADVGLRISVFALFSCMSYIPRVVRITNKYIHARTNTLYSLAMKFKSCLKLWSMTFFLCRIIAIL